jgi:hypothetical protein
MINIKKQYSALSKNEVRHYYLCKRMFGDIKPIKVASIKEQDDKFDKEYEDFKKDLDQNPLTQEETDKSIEDYYKRLEGTLFWPDENDF